MTSEEPAAQKLDATYFDRWYADMATPRTHDEIMARTLGLPPELRSTKRSCRH